MSEVPSGRTAVSEDHAPRKDGRGTTGTALVPAHRCAYQEPVPVNNNCNNNPKLLCGNKSEKRKASKLLFLTKVLKRYSADVHFQ